jgi:hypothetical protein
MLTIAGGIILAVIIIVTAGIWLPLLILAGFWAVIAIIGIGALFLLIFVVPEYLPEGLVKFVEEYWVVAFFLGFTFGGSYMCVLLGNDAIKDRRVFAGYFLKAMGVICLSSGLFFLFSGFYCGLDSVSCEWTTEKTIRFILIASCLYMFYEWATKSSAQDPKPIATDSLEQLKDEFATPECLARNNNKNQMIRLASQFRVKVDRNDTKSNIAKKIFGVEGEADEKILKTESNPAEDKDDVGGEAISLAQKIDQAKENEIARIRDETERAEEAKLKKREAKFKKNEQLKKRFSKIHTAVMELKRTYSTDKDIRVLVYDFSAHLTLLNDWNIAQQRTMAIKLDNNEGFYIKDSNYKNYKKFNGSDEVINYIGEQLGIFLAERESR